MTYYIVKTKQGISANLAFPDNTIRSVDGGHEYLVMSGNHFNRANRDGVFESSRLANSKDFELLVDNTKAEKETQNNDKGKK
jgi:hypothetical protein